MTSQQNDWPHVCRIVWLSGGTVAINNPGSSVQMHSGLNGPALTKLELPAYNSLFQVLKQVGFSIIGATFIQDTDEIKGLIPPEFRAYTKGWQVSEMHQRWSQLAHAASQKNEMVLMDISSRIAYELSYSEIRLLNLAEAYSTQLSGKIQQGQPKEAERFKDLNSSRVYLAIHALFWELAVLRDNLAEFSARFLFKLDHITTFSGLLKVLRHQSKHKSDDIAIELLTAGDDAGWINTFTAYRNLFTHSAPMEQAAGLAFAILDNIPTTNGAAPQLYYPLPNNALELTKYRSSGTLYKSFDELIAASIGRKSTRETEPDALHYLHKCLEQMSLLAERIISRSPITPKMAHLTDADIIGPIQIINR